MRRCIASSTYSWLALSAFTMDLRMLYERYLCTIEVKMGTLII
jgi:hypothetical protein